MSDGYELSIPPEAYEAVRRAVDSDGWLSDVEWTERVQSDVEAVVKAAAPHIAAAALTVMAQEFARVAVEGAARNPFVGWCADELKSWAKVLRSGS